MFDFALSGSRSTQDNHLYNFIEPKYAMFHTKFQDHRRPLVLVKISYTVLTIYWYDSHLILVGWDRSFRLLLGPPGLN